MMKFGGLNVVLILALFCCGAFAIVPTLSPVKRLNPSLETCNLRHETGPCKAFNQRWYYNSGSGKCNEFVYGGCGGNANNFETLQECQAFGQRCRRSTKVATASPNRRPPGSSGRFPGGSGFST